MKKRELSVIDVGTSSQIMEMLQSMKGRKENLNILHRPVRESARLGSSGIPLPSSSAAKRVVLGIGGDKGVIGDLISHKRNDSLGVIPIVGVGGLGKTTLARSVFNDSHLTTDFDVKLWVCVSGVQDVCRIWKQVLVAFSARYDVEGQDLHHIREKLCKCLSYYRFLIVLDDLWNENHEDWDTLRQPFCSGLSGSIIIVTTRSHIVANKMKTMDVIAPKGLSEDDCHSLLCEHAGLVPNESSVYVDIAKKIAKNCSGLPLAAIIVGGLLRNKDGIEEWENILNSKSWTSKDGCVDMVLVIRMCYSDLSPQLKQCFSFFGMLPENYKFKELDMVLLWIGVGILQWLESRKNKKRVGHDCFRQLVSRSLFSPCDDNDEWYVMHGMLRDLAVEASGRNTYFKEDDMIPKPFKGTRYLFCEGTKIEEAINGIVKERKGPLCLRTLFPLFTCAAYSWQRKKIHMLENSLDNMFSRLKTMRALCLQNLKKELPESIDHLILLRYLDLSHGHFQRLPDSVTLLFNLEVINLSFCHSLSQLPEKLGNLMGLCYLDVSCCIRLKKLPAGIGKLQDLAHLDVSTCLSLKKLPAGIGKLQNLLHFDIHSCDGLKELPAGIWKLQSLHHLDLSMCNGLKELPAEIEKLQNLHHLNVSFCRGLRELPTEIEKLQNLSYLNVSWCLGLTELPAGIGKLKNLSHLEFDYCVGIEVLPAGIENLNKLQMLSKLIVGDMLPLSSLEKLNLLQGSLEICGLESVTSPEDARLARLSEKRLDALHLKWYLDWGSDRNQEAMEHEEKILDLLQPNHDLKVLSISGYVGSKFPHWLVASLMQSTRLHRDDYENGTAPQLTRKMLSLEYLSIQHCPLLIMKLPELLPDHTTLTALFVRTLPSDVLRLMLGVQLPNLRELRLQECENFMSFPPEDADLDSVLLTRSVRELELSCFPHLKRISSSQALSSVSELMIKNCQLLEFFPDEGLPASITYLSIIDCPLLTKKLQERDKELCSKMYHISYVHLDQNRFELL